MSPPIATPRSRALGFGLRKTRQERGFGLRQLARATGVHPAELSNWELGLRVPKVEEVALLLGQLRVSVEERERLFELAEHAREPNWLEKEMPDDGDPHDAGRVRAHRGFDLQLAADGRARAAADARLRAGDPGVGGSPAAGGTAPAGGHDPPGGVAVPRARCSFLLGEIALRQPISSPEILLDQLRHLLELPRRLAVRVVPFGGDFHPGLNRSFAVLECSDLPSIVFLDQHRGSAYIYDEDQVADYKSAAKTVTSLALDVDESRACIEGVIVELEA